MDLWSFGLPYAEALPDGDVLVLYADTPLVPKEAGERAFAEIEKGASICVLGFIAQHAESAVRVRAEVLKEGNIFRHLFHERLDRAELRVLAQEGEPIRAAPAFSGCPATAPDGCGGSRSGARRQRTRVILQGGRNARRQILGAQDGTRTRNLSIKSRAL